MKPSTVLHPGLALSILLSGAASAVLIGVGFAWFIWRNLP